MLPVSSTSTTQRAARWPTKSDYKRVSRVEAKALVTMFCDIFGLDALRTGHYFNQLTISSAGSLDNADLGVAIQFIISVLPGKAQAHPDGSPRRQLLQRLESTCGPLDKPIALLIENRTHVFTPASA